MQEQNSKQSDEAIEGFNGEELKLPINKKSKKDSLILKPFRWIKNRYSREVNQWNNFYVMGLYFITDIFLLLLFVVASSSFNIDKLPENKYEFLMGAFALTASIAGLSSISIKKTLNVQLVHIRILFTHAAIILIECVAIVYLVDKLKSADTNWLFPKLVPGGMSLLKWLYGSLIWICTYLWFIAFGQLNKIFWQYTYSKKYLDAEE
ncbi:MAG TPA: hypothetical protein VFG10_14555 [Saprospiraceae bacterium]|nr:hypothetical protein [Saprospiraceae bacterium]